MLSACTGLSGQGRAGGTLRVEVLGHPRLNSGSPLAVDLLVVYDQTLFAELQHLDAAGWFATREQSRRDHGDALDSHLREWVPGQEVPPVTVHYGRRAEGGIVFADYASPGSHRAVVVPLGDFVLDLGETGFTVEADN
jgi:type VI secretion system protein